MMGMASFAQGIASSGSINRVITPTPSAIAVSREAAEMRWRCISWRSSLLVAWISHERVADPLVGEPVGIVFDQGAELADFDFQGGAVARPANGLSDHQERRVGNAGGRVSERDRP
jgi:hypothetical protein